MRDYVRTDPNEHTRTFQRHAQANGPEQHLMTLRLVQEPGQDLAGALKRLHEDHNLMDRVKELIKGEDGEFRTMIHGDAWFGNMLFK